MRYLAILLILLGCSYKPLEIRIGIVHDYIFQNAEKECKKHQGLHYIVGIETIFEKGKNGEYPCTDLYKFRCQDNTLIPFNSGIGHCFISQMQLEKTLGE